MAGTEKREFKFVKSVGFVESEGDGHLLIIELVVKLNKEAFGELAHAALAFLAENRLDKKQGKLGLIISPASTDQTGIDTTSIYNTLRSHTTSEDAATIEQRYLDAFDVIYTLPLGGIPDFVYNMVKLFSSKNEGAEQKKVPDSEAAIVDFRNFSKKS